MRGLILSLSAAALLSLGASRVPAAEPKVSGWLNWRGPHQNGFSGETGIPDKPAPGSANHLWTWAMSGRGTPVITNDRVYAWGYHGEGSDLREVLAAIDARTGSELWRAEFSDYLSDTIYSRYSIGAPSVDPDTGNVYLQTTAGDVVAYTADGEKLWEHSLQEEYGRLTFPNGRTGAAAIDGDLVIFNVISANWGGETPPRNRLYAFHKITGELAWSSTPGVGPPFLKDSSFSTPIFDIDAEGRRVLYVGLGCGNVSKVNARTGEPIWRYQFAIGGLNGSPVIHKNKLIIAHGVENPDSTKTGRMIALRLDAQPTPTDDGSAPTLGRDAEAWRIDGLEMFSASPTLVGDRVFLVDANGILFNVNADTGEVVWSKKIGTAQLHASPLFADGKLYVPLEEGTLCVVRPTDSTPSDGDISKIHFGGALIGSPSVWAGRLFLFSTDALYAFGNPDRVGRSAMAWSLPDPPKPGPAAALRVIPSEFLMQPGDSRAFTVRTVDARGYPIAEIAQPSWEKFVPPTARVKLEVDAEFNERGVLVAGPDASLSAGAFRASADGLGGVTRGRLVPSIPFAEDFNGYDLTETHALEKAAFAYPPLPWIGARGKWDIRELDGEKVLAKTLDSVIQMRAITFMGHPDAHDYIVQADVMTDGNRRLAGDVGVINQRYIIALKGNHDLLEVNSNYERVAESVPFDVQPKQWYTLKSRVDRRPDGSGAVMGKVWKRGEPEPQEWTIRVELDEVHAHGSPGLFGLGPQARVRVYVDNVSVTPAE